jgi:hypothetical protein
MVSLQVAMLFVPQTRRGAEPVPPETMHSVSPHTLWDTPSKRRHRCPCVITSETLAWRSAGGNNARQEVKEMTLTASPLRHDFNCDVAVPGGRPHAGRGLSSLGSVQDCRLHDGHMRGGVDIMLAVPRRATSSSLRLTPYSCS